MLKRTVVWRLCALLLVEGLALVALGVGFAVFSALGHPSTLLGAELAALAAAVAGALLLWLARATSHLRPWARSPAIVLNILPIPVAVGLLQGHVWWVGTPLLLASAAVLYLYATPEARLALREDD